MCIFSFNQELKCCATHNKQFQSPTTVNPFRRLDYDWLVPKLCLLTEMWSFAITHGHAKGETICLRKGLSYTCNMLWLSAGHDKYEAKPSSAAAARPQSKYETNKPYPLVLSGERMWRHWSHTYSSAHLLNKPPHVTRAAGTWSKPLALF